MYIKDSCLYNYSQLYNSYHMVAKLYLFSLSLRGDLVYIPSLLVIIATEIL